MELKVTAVDENDVKQLRLPRKHLYAIIITLMIGIISTITMFQIGQVNSSNALAEENDRLQNELSKFTLESECRARIIADYEGTVAAFEISRTHYLTEDAIERSLFNQGLTAAVTGDDLKTAEILQQISAHQPIIDAAIADLASKTTELEAGASRRVTAVETCRVAVADGTYTGSDSPLPVDLPG